MMGDLESETSSDDLEIREEIEDPIEQGIMECEAFADLTFQQKS